MGNKGACKNALSLGFEGMQDPVPMNFITHEATLRLQWALYFTY